MSQLQLQLPEAIDFGYLRLSSHSKRAPEIEIEQNINQDSPREEGVLSKQAIYELKEYEGFFDQTRRWNNQFSG